MSFLKAVSGMANVAKKPTGGVAKIAAPLVKKPATGLLTGTNAVKKPLPPQASPVARAAVAKPKPKTLAEKMSGAAKKKGLIGISLR